MTQNPRIQACFNRLRAHGHKGLVGWVSAGDYGLDFSRRMLDTLANAGCDVIELALPFSDPMADGSIIQASYERALRRAGQNIPPCRFGVGVGAGHRISPAASRYRVLAAVQLCSTRFCRWALPNLGARAVAAGADGLIVVDMPFEESQLRQPLANLPLEFVQLVAPTTSADRMATTLANRPRPGLRDCGGGGNGRKNCGD
jgi:tryptophan synthase alpha chain